MRHIIATNMHAISSITAACKHDISAPITDSYATYKPLMGSDMWHNVTLISHSLAAQFSAMKIEILGNLRCLSKLLKVKVHQYLLQISDKFH